MKAGRRRLDLGVRFEAQVRRLPAGKRSRLLGWLRERRLRRVFWVMDAATGEWREL